MRFEIAQLDYLQGNIFQLLKNVSVFLIVSLKLRLFLNKPLLVIQIVVLFIIKIYFIIYIKNFSLNIQNFN